MTLDPKPFLSLGGTTLNPQLPRAQGLSLVLHVLVISVLFIQWVSVNRDRTKPLGGKDRPITSLDLRDVMRQLNGSGNGSSDGLLPPTRGNPPPMRPIQIVPPMKPQNPDPELHTKSSIVGPPDIPLPHVDSQTMGSPFMKLYTDSFGKDGGTGIGDRRGRGVGPGGPGDGLGPGEGESGYTAYPKSGRGVTEIVCAFCPNPTYTDEAHKSKFRGSVLLRVVVGPDGRALSVKVTKGAGMGLDESALAAVKNWKFQPARDPSGQAVTAWTIIEVNFYIY